MLSGAEREVYSPMSQPTNTNPKVWVFELLILQGNKMIISDYNGSSALECGGLLYPFKSQKLDRVELDT